MMYGVGPAVTVTCTVNVTSSVLLEYVPWYYYCCTAYGYRC